MILSKRRVFHMKVLVWRGTSYFWLRTEREWSLTYETKT